MTMIHPMSQSLLDRARRGLHWRLSRVRNAFEWRVAQAVHGLGPWCRNEWGHRYQAMSLAEYHYVRGGNPETHEARLLRRLLKPGMTVVDVGANHGLFSLEAAANLSGKGRMLAFEPAPATREVLERNLRENDLDHFVRVFPRALGAAEGWAQLRVHHEYSGLNTLADNDITWNHQRLEADELVEVPVTTLDLVAEAESLDRIDFLKIDVEGFELAVLQGARRLLSEQRIDWIMVEVGDITCANAHVTPSELLDEVESRGYFLRAITPEGAIGARIESFPEGSFAANYLASPSNVSCEEVVVAINSSTRGTHR